MDKIVDAGNTLVAPGFIDLDAIADLDHAILDSWAAADVTNGHLWSESYFRKDRHDVFTLDERVFVGGSTLVQLLRHGVTTLYAHHGRDSSPRGLKLLRKWQAWLTLPVVWVYAPTSARATARA